MSPEVSLDASCALVAVSRSGVSIAVSAKPGGAPAEILLLEGAPTGGDVVWQLMAGTLRRGVAERTHDHVRQVPCGCALPALALARRGRHARHRAPLRRPRGGWGSRRISSPRSRSRGPPIRTSASAINSIAPSNFYHRGACAPWRKTRANLPAGSSGNSFIH